MKSVVFLIVVAAISVECRLLHDPEPQTDIQPISNFVQRVQSRGYPLESRSSNETFLNAEELAQVEKIQSARDLLRGTVNCDDTSIRVGDKCLIFSDDKLNWNDARESCYKDKDAILATFEKWSDSMALYDYYHRHYGCGSFWLGGNDISEEGTWEWVTRAPLTSDSLAWICGQPDNRNNEDCLEIGYKSGFNDATCSYEKRYICEKRSTRSDYQCANGRHDHLAPNGGPAECNGFGSVLYCCSNHGWCGDSSAHCDCDTCIDYRPSSTTTAESYSTTGSP